MSRLIARGKQTITVNVGIALTPISFIPNTFGAQAILIHLRNGASANLTTVSAGPSMDGLTAFGNTLAVVASPAGASLRADQGALAILIQDPISQRHKIYSPFVQLLAITAVAGGNITFDIWKMFELEDDDEGSSEL